MKPTVLITGGSGLLGINWAYAIRHRFQVMLGAHSRKVELCGTHSLQLGLNSVDELTRQFEVVKPQIVIHTAGLTSVEKCEFDPMLAKQSNIDLASNVARVSAFFQVPFVHISTDHLFSGENAFSDESTIASPINIYGKTKAEAEIRVLEENPDALVIRTNFYGWGTSYRKSFSDNIIESLRCGKKLELFEDVFYTPILAETVVHVTHDLIGLKAAGIFNVVGDTRLSKFDFGVKLAKEFGLDVALIKPTLISGRKNLVERPYDMSLKNKKAVEMLGRRLGSIDEQLTQLYKQEKCGLAAELKEL